MEYIPKQIVIKCATEEMREDRRRGGKRHKWGLKRLVPHPWSEEKKRRNGDLLSTSKPSAGGSYRFKLPVEMLLNEHTSNERLPSYNANAFKKRVKGALSYKQGTPKGVDSVIMGSNPWQGYCCVYVEIIKLSIQGDLLLAWIRV
jgi:hypothetical protein